MTGRFKQDAGRDVRGRRLRIAAALVALAVLAAAPVTALARHGHHKKVNVLPSMGAQPGPSLFGIDPTSADPSRANFLSEFSTARKLGARWVRFNAPPTTASGDFNGLDYEVTQSRKLHMGVLVTFGGIAKACSIRPKPAKVSSCPPTTAADLATYQAYVRTVLVRYRNVVTYYESWAEPDNQAQWEPNPDPSQYTALLKAQYAVFQSVNQQYGTHLKLLFGSPINFASIGFTLVPVLPWTEDILTDLGGARAFDGVALHAYRLPPGTYGPTTPEGDNVANVPLTGTGPFPAEGCKTSPECPMTWSQELAAYEQEFTNHGYGQPPMWLTEFGWPGNAKAKGAFYPGEPTQSQFLKQAYQALLSLPYVKGAIWFNLRDYSPSTLSSNPPFFYHFGLLSFGFSKKPAAKAFTALAKAHPGR